MKEEEYLNARMLYLIQTVRPMLREISEGYNLGIIFKLLHLLEMKCMKSLHIEDETIPE